MRRLSRWTLAAFALCLLACSATPGAHPDLTEPDAGEISDVAVPERPDSVDVAAEDLLAPDVPDVPDVPDIPDIPDVPEPPDLITEPDVFDPTAVEAWEPEGLGPNPRLFFSAEDLPALRERAALEEGPHARLWAALLTYAQQDHDTNDADSFDHRLSVIRSQTAEAAALVGEIQEDAALVQKAAAMLAAPFTHPEGESPFDNYGIEEAEALVGWCTAYDIVAGSTLVDEAAKAAARERLVERVTTYRGVLSTPLFLAMHSAVFNNHPAKALSALGLCALAMNDHPQAALDIHDGLTGLLYIFKGFQASEDGGFGEGWNYLVYGDNNYLPFLAAYHRYAQGRTLPYLDVGTFTSSRDEDTGEIVDVVDPAVDPSVRIVYERALQSTFPNGWLPDTDDANSSRLHGGLLAALFDDGRFLDNWLTVGNPGGRPGLATFAMLDPDMARVAPAWPADQWHYEAGFTLMRSDLGPDALWFPIQGEHGTVRIGGVGHEHPDATNVLLWYRGEPLLIDPGYIKWGEHEKVCYAKDHSIILVDGEGPPYPSFGASVGVDAYLEDWEEGERLTSVVSRARWQGVDVARRAVRVDGRFFVLVDTLSPLDDEAHGYTYQMNGLGGGDLGEDSFSLLADGARWLGTNADVDVRVVPFTGAAAYGSRLEEHTEGYGAWGWHEMLTVDVEATGETGFLSLLLPVAHDEEAPTATIDWTGEGHVTAQIAWDGVDYVIDHQAGALSITADGTEL